jgi:hypothetical protein
MPWRGTKAVVFAISAVLVLAAAFSASATASPVWKFEGSELTGKAETIVGDATLSSLTIPGLTTTCKKMHYEMTISNSLGTGKGSFNALSFKTCFTSSKECAVETINAEKLPWATHLVTVSASNYVVIEGIKVGILYSGGGCALGGTLITVTGSAAGLYDNTSETFALDSSSFKATKTSLKALGSAAEWQGVFTTEATGVHSGEALTIS